MVIFWLTSVNSPKKLCNFNTSLTVSVPQLHCCTLHTANTVQELQLLLRRPPSACKIGGNEYSILGVGDGFLGTSAATMKFVLEMPVNEKGLTGFVWPKMTF